MTQSSRSENFLVTNCDILICALKVNSDRTIWTQYSQSREADEENSKQKTKRRALRDERREFHRSVSSFFNLFQILIIFYSRINKTYDIVAFMTRFSLATGFFFWITWWFGRIFGRFLLSFRFSFWRGISLKIPSTPLQSL